MEIRATGLEFPIQKSNGVRVYHGDNNNNNNNKMNLYSVFSHRFKNALHFTFGKKKEEEEGRHYLTITVITTT